MEKVRLKEVLDLFGTSDAGQNDLTDCTKNRRRKIILQSYLSFFQ